VHRAEAQKWEKEQRELDHRVNALNKQTKELQGVKKKRTAVEKRRKRAQADLSEAQTKQTQLETEKDNVKVLLFQTITAVFRSYLFGRRDSLCLPR
jgi:septal ring factor EnvC (AmiA/AmiB activator)